MTNHYLWFLKGLRIIYTSTPVDILILHLVDLFYLKVGDREDSNIYIGQKVKNAGAIGVNARHIRLPKTCTQEEVSI